MPETTVAVHCGGSRHTVRWHRGRLQLVDHPHAEAEAVLAAFGGDRPACLRLRELWRTAVDDGGFLTEWALAEHPDPVRFRHFEAALARLAREGVQDVLPALDLHRAERMGTVLTRLSPALLDRAALATTQRLLRRPDLRTDELVPWLARGVQVRARSAFVRSLDRWKDHARPAALVRFRCRVGLGVTPHACGHLDGRASSCDVVVDLRWLLDVWGRGVATLDGDLVLAVDRSRALVVDWRPAGPDDTPRAGVRWRPLAGPDRVIAPADADAPAGCGAS